MHEFNSLINETSPYLLQHADNPVAWFPWGEAAFEKARRENKPVLLSVGYAACHWCHVMAHESFESEEIAEVMNAMFVNIKVDREERPDVDQLYMQFLQMYTGSGGWPMTIFLTPDKKPFFGGTYFPPDDRYGRPGFSRLLGIVSNFYHNEKQKLEQLLSEVENGFSQLTVRPHVDPDFSVDRAVFDSAVKKLAGLYEPRHGGIGNAPKFPAVQALSLFLRYHRNTGDTTYLDMVTHTLQEMARGGIFDQLGGGFARYSVDEKWLVPHFEKMLYDNAQLAELYLDTYLVTRDPFYKDIAERTLDFMVNELKSPEGGFYSSLDADSEGEEGRYYVWSKQEIVSLLDGDQAKICCGYYGVTDTGNFEGRNILHISDSMENVAQRYNLSEKAGEELLEKGKAELLANREQRVRPGLDDKIITSWNGLAMTALARYVQLTGEARYRNILIELVAFIKSRLFVNGVLKRTYKNEIVKYDAYLSDYAALIRGLLDAYEAVFDAGYLSFASELMAYVNARFRDNEQDGYFFTSQDQEQLIERLRDDHDQSIPSGTGLILLNNLRLYALTGDSSLIRTVESVFHAYGPDFSRNPYGYASYLHALDYYLTKPGEILILKKRKQSAGIFLEAIFDRYFPNKVVVLMQPDHRPDVLSANLFEGKEQYADQVTVFVCRDSTCSLPVCSVKELSLLLN